MSSSVFSAGYSISKISFETYHRIDPNDFLLEDRRLDAHDDDDDERVRQWQIRFPRFRFGAVAMKST